MKNTNTKEFNDNLKAYLAPIIQARAEDYGESEQAKANPYKWAIETAKKEVPHEFTQHGDQGGLTSWLQGCALNIEIYNTDIVGLAERLHKCTLTDKQKETVCEKWFSFLAAKMLQYARKG